MKKIFVFLILFVTLFLVVKSSYAYVRVRGYFRRSTGSYVIPHFRTNPDGFKFNNWSFKGNINPFTFKKGWKW
jgi:hypothetical protein